MKIAFEKWLEENEIPDEAITLFEESIRCYKISADCISINCFEKIRILFRLLFNSFITYGSLLYSKSKSLI